MRSPVKPGHRTQSGTRLRVISSTQTYDSSTYFYANVAITALAEAKHPQIFSNTWPTIFAGPVKVYRGRLLQTETMAINREGQHSFRFVTSLSWNLVVLHFYSGSMRDALRTEKSGFYD